MLENSWLVDHMVIFILSQLTLLSSWITNSVVHPICPLSCKIHAIVTKLKSLRIWHSPNVSTTWKVHSESIYWAQNVPGTVIEKVRVLEALYEGPHMATLVTTQLHCQAKQMLVRFIFTVSFLRKGWVKAEVRLTVDILIYLLVCSLFTLSLALGIPIHKLTIIFENDGTNWEFLFPSGWKNRPFKLK